MSRLQQPKGALARGAGVLVGGAAAGQLLTMLAAPLLTRLYPPEAFGALAAFVGILTLCTVGAAARYEIAIPVPEKDTDAVNLTLLCVIFGVLFSAVAAIGFFLFGRPISNALNSPELESYLWIIPLAALAGIIYEIFFNLSLRKRKYKLIAKTRVAQAFGTASVQVIGSSFGAFALIGGQAIGQGLGSLSLMFSNIRRYSWGECSIKGLKRQAYIHRRYPQYSLWSALFNTVSVQFAPLIFIAAYGTAVGGFYALTLRVISIPGGLVGGAIGSVFLAEAPDAIRQKELKQLVSTSHKHLAMLGALPLVTLLFFGEDLFRLVFGDAWGRAGTFAQMMAPWIYLQFQWAPLSTIGNLLDLQKQILLTHVLSFVARCSVLAICALGSVAADDGVLAFSAVSAIFYFLTIIWFFGKAGLSIREVVLTDLKYISTAMLICLPLYFFEWP